MGEISQIWARAIDISNSCAILVVLWGWLPDTTAWRGNISCAPNPAQQSCRRSCLLRGHGPSYHKAQRPLRAWDSVGSTGFCTQFHDLFSGHPPPPSPRSGQKDVETECSSLSKETAPERRALWPRPRVTFCRAIFWSQLWPFEQALFNFISTLPLELKRREPSQRKEPLGNENPSSSAQQGVAYFRRELRKAARDPESLNTPTPRWNPQGLDFLEESAKSRLHRAHLGWWGIQNLRLSLLLTRCSFPFLLWLRAGHL